jgi:ribosomal protein L11 methyltransferase
VDEQAHWLEVSLVINGELAEAVADVLGRYVSNGVVVESGVKYNDAEDEGTPVGPVKVYGYLSADEYLEEKRQKLEEALWHLGQIQTLPALSYRTIVDEDWMASWRSHYQPIPVGNKLLVLPSWVEMDPGGRIPIRMTPGMAFGTGTHPTTHLCLDLEESCVQPGEDVIDVGCGSGILSIAAVKLGARKVLAVDIDSAAVRATREAAQANGVAAAIESGLGSVGEVKAGQFGMRSAPLVLANILAPVIVRLFDAGLADLVAPGGTLVLSGILDKQAEDVRVAGRAKGLTFTDLRQIDDWVALVAIKAA